MSNERLRRLIELAQAGDFRNKEACITFAEGIDICTDALAWRTHLKDSHEACVAFAALAARGKAICTREHLPFPADVVVRRLLVLLSEREIDASVRAKIETEIQALRRVMACAT